MGHGYLSICPAAKHKGMKVVVAAAAAAAVAAPCDTVSTRQVPGVWEDASAGATVELCESDDPGGDLMDLVVTADDKRVSYLASQGFCLQEDGKQVVRSRCSP